jgi:hypothetical protein
MPFMVKSSKKWKRNKWGKGIKKIDIEREGDWLEPSKSAYYCTFIIILTKRWINNVCICDWWFRTSPKIINNKWPFCCCCDIGFELFCFVFVTIVTTIYKILAHSLVTPSFLCPCCQETIRLFIGSRTTWSIFSLVFLSFPLSLCVYISFFLYLSLFVYNLLKGVKWQVEMNINVFLKY